MVAEMTSASQVACNKQLLRSHLSDISSELYHNLNSEERDASNLCEEPR